MPSRYDADLCIDYAECAVLTTVLAVTCYRRTQQQPFAIDRQRSALLRGVNTTLEIGQPIGITLWR